MKLNQNRFNIYLIIIKQEENCYLFIIVTITINEIQLLIIRLKFISSSVKITSFNNARMLSFIVIARSERSIFVATRNSTSCGTSGFGIVAITRYIDIVNIFVR